VRMAANAFRVHLLYANPDSGNVWPRNNLILDYSPEAPWSEGGNLSEPS
jgi:hypothetical protein